MYSLWREAFHKADTLGIRKEIGGPAYIAYALAFLLLGMRIKAEVEVAERLAVCFEHLRVIPL